MINSAFQVTFGIEVECILAFHETLLHDQLAASKSQAKIIKDIPDETRQNLNQVSQHYLDEDTRQHDTSRQKYMGWALTTPTAYPPERDNIRFQRQFDKHLTEYGYRAYGGEILHVAQNLLPAGVRAHDSFHSGNKYTDFSHWHLTHERGLVGVDKEELTRQFDKTGSKKAENMPERQQTMMDTEDWDSHPLELVSRVLPYNDASITELHQHLTALQAGPDHFAFATKHCGLHVHVGLPVPGK